MNAFQLTSESGVLSPEEVKSATASLIKPIPFRKINRRFIDPQKHGEPKFALFSFVKSQDAIADKDGFFGVGKIRGVFYTEKEASERAEEIIRDVDSTNSIHTCMVGVPFPLVVQGYAEELSEINLQNKVESAISDNVRAKRKAEQKEMEEIKRRKEELMDEESRARPENPEDKYISQRVKLAHLRYAIIEHTTKLAECKELEKKVIVQLKEESQLHPEYEEIYMDRYKKARRDVGIPESEDSVGFMKFMAAPIE